MKRHIEDLPHQWWDTAGLIFFLCVSGLGFIVLLPLIILLSPIFALMLVATAWAGKLLRFFRHDSNH